MHGSGSGWGIVFLVIGIALLLGVCLFLFCSWQIFKKAGLPPWKCLVPFYNFHCYIVRIARLPLVLSILLFLSLALGLVAEGAFYLVFGYEALVPDWFHFATGCLKLAQIAIYCVTMLKLAGVFGQSLIVGVGLIVFPWIFLPWLAFGNAKYLSRAGRRD
ncbi:MAG: DUF5684 domain-containing protein [Fusobacteriaceae bacterium]|nr:DUF5684 domain-containing protein [Fusobacteriaceae bacterium]